MIAEQLYPCKNSRGGGSSLTLDEAVDWCTVVSLSLLLPYLPGPYLYADVLDLKHLHSIVVNYGIDWVIHFAALLSAIGEKEPRRALDVGNL